jgi:hypothetical protein
VHPPDDDAQSSQRGHKHSRRESIGCKVSKLPNHHGQEAGPPYRLPQVAKTASTCAQQHPASLLWTRQQHVLCRLWNMPAASLCKLCAVLALTCSQARCTCYPQTPLLYDKAAPNEDAAADGKGQAYALLLHVRMCSFISCLQGQFCGLLAQGCGSSGACSVAVATAAGALPSSWVCVCSGMLTRKLKTVQKDCQRRLGNSLRCAALKDLRRHTYQPPRHTCGTHRPYRKSYRGLTTAITTNS